MQLNFGHHPAVVAEWVYERWQIQVVDPRFESRLGPFYAIPVIVVVDCVMEVWFAQVSREIGYETL